MIRRVSDYGVEKISQWESLRLDAYQDQAGKWTIGYGHTEGVKPGDACTKAEAVDWLLADLTTAECAVNELVKVPLAVHQFDALCSFVFNVGVGAFKSSTLLKKLNAGNYEDVPSEFTRWNKITDPTSKEKVTSPGLTNRRAAEIGLWARGSYVASAAPDVAPQGSSVAGAVKSGTGKAAITVGGTVAAVGAVLQALPAMAPHLELLEDLVHKAPMVMAFAAVLAVGTVILWRVKRN